MPQNGSVLPFGFYDLNHDGILDTLSFSWNGKAALFISDDGKLPFPTDENTDWNAFFNEAFCVGKPQNPWNPMRIGWGNYTLLIDKDGCGRYDSLGDYCYRAFDVNRDGYPEAEYYHLFPGEDWCPYSNKFVVNLNGEPDLSYLDFEKLTYPDEQKYDEGGKYRMNVHGSGFFVNSYSAHPETSWETPIAWYDFNQDGKTEMVMRVADVENNAIIQSGGLRDLTSNGHYSGKVSEFELAFELNGDTNDQKWSSLDLHLSFYQYQNPNLDYTIYKDTLPFIKPLAGSEAFYGNLADIRLSDKRQYLPYLDGAKIGLTHPDWQGAFLLFDEDNDDCRWEEMFSNHEGDNIYSNTGWKKFSDHIGDRTEKDTDFLGKGKLYIGKFDGKIHLYHAEHGWWEIDYLALFKGSSDHADTDEGPLPLNGLRYPCVRYYDTTGNGFIDTITYSIVEYGSENEQQQVLKTIRLADFADEELPNPDVCDLLDITPNTPMSEFRLENWDGNPLSKETLEASPAKQCYNALDAIYETVCNQMWDSAQMLYQTACRFHLNISENEDKELRTDYTIEERLALSDILIPKGYSCHLQGNTRREKYHNGFWLRQKVFEDICADSRLDRFTLEKYFYTGRYKQLCDYITNCLSK
jgi:hypothetical protein